MPMFTGNNNSFINVSNPKLNIGRPKTRTEGPLFGNGTDGDQTLSTSTFSGGVFNQNNMRYCLLNSVAGNSFANSYGNATITIPAANAAIFGTLSSSVVGNFISGPGIPGRTTISAYYAANTLSCNVTSGQQAITSTNNSTATLCVGMGISGAGIPANSYITGFGPTGALSSGSSSTPQFTINQNATATSTPTTLTFQASLVLSTALVQLTGPTVCYYNITSQANFYSRFCDAPCLQVTAIGSDNQTLTVQWGNGIYGSVWDLYQLDQCILINLRGDSTYNNNVGNWELAQVGYGSFYTATSLTQATLVLNAPLLGQYGAANNQTMGNQVLMLMRLPQYGNLTLGSGMTYRCGQFNGQVGGVCAFQAQNLVQNATSCVISASGLGYRAGSGAGYTGESVTGSPTSNAVSTSGGGTGGTSPQQAPSGSNGVAGSSYGGGGGGGAGGAGGGSGSGGAYFFAQAAGALPRLGCAGGGGGGGSANSGNTQGGSGVTATTSTPGAGGTGTTGSGVYGSGGNGGGTTYPSYSGAAATSGTGIYGDASIAKLYMGSAGGNAGAGGQGGTGGAGGATALGGGTGGNGGGGGGGGGGFTAGAGGAGGAGGTGTTAGQTGSSGSAGGTGGAGGNGGGAVLLWLNSATLLNVTCSGAAGAAGAVGGAAGANVAAGTFYGGNGGGGGAGGGGGGGAGGSIYVFVRNLISFTGAQALAGAGGVATSTTAGGGGTGGAPGGAGGNPSGAVAGVGSPGRIRFNMNLYASATYAAFFGSDGAGVINATNIGGTVSPVGYKGSL